MSPRQRLHGRFHPLPAALYAWHEDEWRAMLTHHDAAVAYPMLLDRRTLLYVSTADDGTGPWLYSMDVDERVARRVTTGVEHTLSVAAAAPIAGAPRRLDEYPAQTAWFQAKGVVGDGAVRAGGFPLRRGVGRATRRVYLVSALVAAATVSAAGLVGFVGLVVPHHARATGRRAHP